jgi:hypothetical protein
MILGSMAGTGVRLCSIVVPVYESCHRSNMLRLAGQADPARGIVMIEKSMAFIAMCWSSGSRGFLHGVKPGQVKMTLASSEQRNDWHRLAAMLRLISMVSAAWAVERAVRGPIRRILTDVRRNNC